MPRYKIVVNPTSGRGNGARLYSEIKQKLEAHQLDFDMVTTNQPWHGYEITREAVRQGFDVVVAVGGDGTANEVINGLMDANQAGEGSPAMGVVTVGRGNDFAYSMGLPTNWETCIDILANDKRRWIDIGKLTGGDYPQGRYFGNGMGMGFDAVVGFVAVKLKPLSGFLSYIVAAIATAFIYYKAPLVQVDYDDQSVTLSSLMVSVMNGNRLGGGFFMAPNAIIDDGLFNLNIVTQVPKLKIFYLLTKYMSGKQVIHPAVSTPLAGKITITAKEGSLPVHSDGETICKEGKQLVIEMFHKGIQLVVPG